MNLQGVRTAMESGDPGPHVGRSRQAVLALVLALAWVGVCPATDDILRDPSCLDEAAPPGFRVEVKTSRGSFMIEVERHLAPLGADRFFNLTSSGFYDQARFFRVIPGLVALTGLHADPAVGEIWLRAEMADDPVRIGNSRGTVAFANAGPNTRTTQFFVNLRDNPRLDGLGYAPFGRVISGLEIVEQLYGGYADPKTRDPGPRLDKIREFGNAYLNAKYPRLDYIIKTHVYVPTPVQDRKTEAPAATGAPR